MLLVYGLPFEYLRAAGIAVESEWMYGLRTRVESEKKYGFCVDFFAF